MKTSLSRSDPNLVSISLFLPFDGIDHAGGELLLSHYRVLAQRFARLDAFAIDFSDNVVAVGRASDVRAESYQPTAIAFPRWRRMLIGKILARLWYWLFPVFPDIGILAGIVTSPLVRSKIRSAEVIELQWFECFLFAPWARRLNSAAKIVGFAHDVPSQKYERKFGEWPASARRIYIAYVRWLERKLVKCLDSVSVLSDKDADLLKRWPSSPAVFVLDPPLAENIASESAEAHQLTTSAEISGSTKESFGFIGAFHRPENDDAAIWLLTEIWPQVLHRRPNALLYLVGSKPSKSLTQTARSLGQSVIVTGYVDSIDEYYPKFDTVVIPLRYGAGVKFKTISGVLARKNIVATPIAVEGVLDHSYYFAISERADDLASAMIELAQNPVAGVDLVESALSQVAARYSLESYSRELEKIYQP